MFLFAKQSRWRIVHIFRPKVVIITLFVAFFILVEPIESSFARPPHSGKSSSIIITKTATHVNIIHWASNTGMPFHKTYSWNIYPHGNSCCWRYSWGLRIAKPEEANDDDDDDDEVDDDNNTNEHSTKSSLSSSSSLQKQHQQEKDSERSLEEMVDSFLDQEFFNPSRVNENSPFKWFANLVERDYETAEALYASIIIVMLVIVSQELLRMQINGLHHYVPFTRGAASSAIGGGLW
jgi:hypothetical protein